MLVMPQSDEMAVDYDVYGQFRYEHSCGRLSTRTNCPTAPLSDDCNDCKRTLITVGHTSLDCKRCDCSPSKCSGAAAVDGRAVTALRLRDLWRL